MGLIPVIMCFTVSTFLGPFLLMLTGLFYGYLALGKKFVE